MDYKLYCAKKKSLIYTIILGSLLITATPANALNLLGLANGTLQSFNTATGSLISSNGTAPGSGILKVGPDGNIYLTTSKYRLNS